MSILINPFAHTSALTTWDFSTSTDGTITNFVSNDAGNMTGARADSEHVVFGYHDATDGAIKLLVVKVDETTGTVTIGTPVTLESSSIAYLVNVAVLNGRGMVWFRESGGNNAADGYAFDYSGTTISSVGARLNIQNHFSRFGSCHMVSSTAAIVTYAETQDTTQRVRTYAINDGTLALSQSDSENLEDESSTSENNTSAQLDATTYVCCYSARASGSENDLIAELITLDGSNNITAADTLTVLADTSDQYLAACGISDTQAVLLYWRQSDNKLHAVVITDTSGTLSSGTPVHVNGTIGIGTATSYLSCSKADDGTVLISWCLGGSSNGVNVASYSVDGSVLTLIGEAEKANSSNQYAVNTIHAVGRSGEALLAFERDESPQGLEYQTIQTG